MTTEPTQPTAPPVIAIVGRPNVGKSALFNYLSRERISIVDPKSGVTRDRVSHVIDCEGRLLELCDTGGMGSSDDLAAEVENQINIALQKADLILFVVDAQDGLVPADTFVAERLRPLASRVVLVANKVDSARHESTLGDFYTLGYGHPLPVSAINSLGRPELLSLVLERAPAFTQVAPEPELQIAVVGRQNVGKSTLINTLANEDRVIVSETPGSTRDSIDVRFELDGRSFLAIDTAGVKHRAKLKESVEYYSITRTDASIRRADVTIFMIDASTDLARMDVRIAHRIEELGKPCVIAVNKWDLARGITTGDYTDYLEKHFPIMGYAPIIFISAKEGVRVRELIDLARKLSEQSNIRVPTAKLNQIIDDAQTQRRPERRRNLQPKLFYANQLPGSPPTFLIFASSPQLITDNYTRYLANFLREALGGLEVPVRVFFRSRHTTESDRATPPPRHRPGARRRRAEQAPDPDSGED